MKYGLLTFRECINLGDEIQSLAAKQFLPQVDYLIDRDHTYEHKDKEETKVIMNGYYMNKPENWPPPSNIKPLYISFHLNQGAKENFKVVRPELAKYYKQHEPIGCRDVATQKLFEEIGIKAYYSACLTLTLENKFTKRNENIYCVDAFYGVGERFQKQAIKKLVPKNIREHLIYLNQDISDPLTVEEKFNKAQELLDIYAQAKLVITSRIHCALPCLAMGTPVLFINVGLDNKANTTRITELISMMHTVDSSYFPEIGFSRKHRVLKNIGFYNIYSLFKKVKFNWDNPPQNPVDIKPIADSLRKTVNQFINE